MGEVIEGKFVKNIPNPCPQCGRVSNVEIPFCPRCNYGFEVNCKMLYEDMQKYFGFEEK